MAQLIEREGLKAQLGLPSETSNVVRFAQAKFVRCLWGQDHETLRSHERTVDRTADRYAASFKAALSCLRSEELLDQAQRRELDALEPDAVQRTAPLLASAAVVGHGAGNKGQCRNLHCSEDRPLAIACIASGR